MSRATVSNSEALNAESIEKVARLHRHLHICEASIAAGERLSKRLDNAFYLSVTALSCIGLVSLEIFLRDLFGWSGALFLIYPFFVHYVFSHRRNPAADEKELRDIKDEILKAERGLNAAERRQLQELLKGGSKLESA